MKAWLCASFRQWYGIVWPLRGGGLAPGPLCRVEPSGPFFFFFFFFCETDLIR